MKTLRSIFRRKKKEDELSRNEVPLVDGEGRPVPRNRQEELQMRFHLTPRLHRDLPGGQHNN
jgi:hypothetical protein